MSIELKEAAQQALDLSTPTLREMVTRHAAVIDSRATLEDMPEALAFQIDMARALLREFTAIHQAEAQQPATGKPVAWLHVCRKKPELRELSFSKAWPNLAALGYKARPLVLGDTHPAPNDPLTLGG